MLEALTAEIFKLRVRRAVIVTISALAAIAAGAQILQAVVASGGLNVTVDFAEGWGIHTFGAFVFAGLGAVLVGGEFRSKVLTTELVRGQTRLQLVAAKLIAFLVLGLAAAVAIGLAMIVGVLIATVVGDVTYPADWFEDAAGDWAGGLARAAFALAAGAVFGSACGMVVRSPGAAVGTALAYFAFLEPAAIAFIELVWDVETTPGLFYSIEELRDHEMSVGAPTMTQGEAGAALAGWLAALALLQVALFTRRDIT